MTVADHRELPSVRVLVVDDHRLVLEGIASVLEAQPEVTVVGTATNGQEAIDQARELSPDVVVMDVRMPVMNGIDALISIRAALPGCHVVMLSEFDDEHDSVRALRAGASGYLHKGIAAANLTRAILLAHAGVSSLDHIVAQKIVTLVSRSNGRAGTDASRAPVAHLLTRRELQVLGLVAEGASNREIASRLNVSEGTVKNHVSHILGRLGLRDRTQAAAVYAREHRPS